MPFTRDGLNITVYNNIRFAEIAEEMDGDNILF